MQKWIQKQGRRTGPKFIFHACPVHDQNLCDKWTKANPRKDYVPCAVESFTVYTCSSYYCRSIRTSLSSLQSHLLTDICGTSARRQELDDDALPMYMTSAWRRRDVTVFTSWQRDWTGPIMLIVVFLVSHFNFLFVPCGGLSWLPVSFLPHVKYTLSYRIVS